jgi:hypothetical protein
MLCELLIAEAILPAILRTRGRVPKQIQLDVLAWFCFGGRITTGRMSDELGTSNILLLASKKLLPASPLPRREITKRGEERNQ